MSDNIYDILQRFQRLDEDISAQQRAVKQLPALFQPPASPTSATGFQKNATRGYLVGEGEEQENVMGRAVLRRIVNQHPEWIVKYGAEFLMQVVDDVTEGDDWEEIGSSDVSAYVNMVHDQLQSRGGSREKMRDRRPFAEQGVSEEVEQIDEISLDLAKRARDKAEHIVDMDYDDLRMKPFGHSEKQRIKFQKYVDKKEAPRTYYRVGQHILRTRGNLHQASEDEILIAAEEALEDMEFSDTQIQYMMRDPDFQSDVIEFVRRGPVTESATTEDVLSSVKKKLGDYLSDLSKEIKSDPDLKDRVPADINKIKSVKTITTDDGHEIKIHGNEDDGFRVSIQDRDSKTKFKDLDEATMAVEMYCARRREREISQLNDDYVDEA